MLLYNFVTILLFLFSLTSPSLNIPTSQLVLSYKLLKISILPGNCSLLCFEILSICTFWYGLRLTQGFLFMSLINLFYSTHRSNFSSRKNQLYLEKLSKGAFPPQNIYKN